MSTTESGAENATAPESRSIDHDRYTRACAEEMAVEPLAPNMLTVEHGGENYDVDLVSGTCDCADAHYRPSTYCKHSLKAALVAIYTTGVQTPFVAHVARYIDEHPCPSDNEHICSGPTGPQFPCPECVTATTVGDWQVWHQTAGRTGARR